MIRLFANAKPRALVLRLAGIAAIAGGMAGCHTDMWVQPKIKAQQEIDLFPDGASNRPLVPGTIARDHLREDDAFFTGFKNGKLVTKIPIEITKESLLRGKERFTIYCTPCHGQLGNGQGMIATRGFTLRRPVGNYHTDRLRNMPIGHFYDVITNGYGAMYSYASRVEPQDRWAIAAYIRVLQLSQHAKLSDLDPDEMKRVLSGAPVKPAPNTNTEAGAEHE